ncbi:MAG: hypothetical protein Unbinned400contig1002_42 [Prokaryotic dsDNA virus sp.]|nr:MAG: hypothetical protein Unbinned400contig1002_42 [Prokaryotic dsDNA virus sp.]
MSNYNFEKENKIRKDLITTLTHLFDANKTREEITGNPLTKKQRPKERDVLRVAGTLATVSPMVHDNKSNSWAIDAGTLAAYIIREYDPERAEEVTKMRMRLNLWLTWYEDLTKPWQNRRPAARALTKLRQDAKAAFEATNVTNNDESWANLA